MNKEKLLQIDIELRNLSESVKGGTVTPADVQIKLDSLKAEKRAIEQEIALAEAPIEKRGGDPAPNLADVKDAMIQKRAITLNGTGAINQVRELAKELSMKREILRLVRWFQGPNASTNIPVLSPGLAVPGGFPEGATDIGKDSQAVLGSRNLTPHAFVSILPVSAETISMGIVNPESELPAIFADAFAEGLARQVLIGDGTGQNFRGLFHDIVAGNQIPCGAAGGPRVADLAGLAMRIRDMTDDGTIVLHGGTYARILADNTAGVAELYKEELIRNKTIEGVRVLVTGFAPSSVSAGATVAVAGRLSDYGIAVAGELKISPIERVGDTRTFYQATMFANGSKIVDKNFFALTAV